MLSCLAITREQYILHVIPSWKDSQNISTSNITSYGNVSKEMTSYWMVDCGEVLKFKLGVPGMEPFKEHDFVVGKERSLKDICDPLMLLCVRRQVVDVTRNDGLR